MGRLLALGLAAALISAGAGVAKAELAVTEFLNNVLGNESTNEWMEIYNYGSSPIDLDGYTVSDNNGTFVFPGGTIAPGEAIILAQDPAGFAANWPTVTAQVFGPWALIINLANTDDQIVLNDPSGALIWRLGYDDDETAGRATFLATTDFSIADYGTELSPLVVRDGDDATSPAQIGYESNDATADPLAFSGVDGDFGSPGAAMPEPGAAGLLACALAILGAAALRRGRG